MNSPKLSFCLPVYNEEKVLTTSIRKIENKLTKTLGPGNFEILVVNNASTDQTGKKLSRLAKKDTIRAFYIERKGLGVALKKAIEEAKFNNLFFTGIDLPFGFGDLDQMLSKHREYDILFGSKNHSESLIVRTKKRLLVSKVYKLMFQSLFKSSCSDPQGSIFMKKNKILPLLPHCRAENSFFTTQLAIYASLFKLSLGEVAVEMRKEIRPSRVNILVDGSHIFMQFISEKLYYQKVKTNYEHFQKPHK